MPQRTVLDLPPAAHAMMLAARRRARDGYWLALHLVLWCAGGRHPTAIAAVRLCARASVQRTVRADREGTLGREDEAQGRLAPPGRTTVLVPTRRRARLALLKAAPRGHGWCRTRWRCATLALTLDATRGLTVSAEPRRRWVHEVGWVWQRAQLVATDEDPHRVDRLARLRFTYAPWRLGEAIVWAADRARHLVPTVGQAGMPPGPHVEGITPGTHAKPDLAGALELATGPRHPCQGPRQTHGRLRGVLQTLADAQPVGHDQRVDGVVDHDQIHQAKAVDDWLAHPPRVPRRFWPTDGPRANPSERACGEVPDLCTRHQTRKRVPDLGADVEVPLHVHGPWTYQLSERSDEPAVTAAVENIAIAEHAKVAACVYQCHVD